MDQELLPDEINRSITKLDKADLRKEISTGWGATTGGLAITKRYHERLTDGVRAALLGHRSKQRDYAEAELLAVLKGLSPSVIALSCIQSILHSIGLRETLRDTLVSLGSNIGNECWAAKLTERNGSLAARIARASRAGRTTAQRYNLVRGKVERAKAKNTKEHSEAQRADAKSLLGFKERIWTRPALMTAGGWLWNVVSTSIPEVFERVQYPGNPEWMLTVSQEAWGVFDAAIDHATNTRPVFWPSAQEPKPWTASAGGGSHDERVNGVVTVLRSFHKDTQAAVRRAIKAGTMQPALDALNTLQAVPFKINHKVMDVIRECHGYQIGVKGLPTQNVAYEPKLSPFAEEAEQRLWKIKQSETRKANLGLIGDRALFDLDMQVAEAMAKHEAFYTPMNLDWRGRVYGLPHFNFQREDRVRALFLFADGLPIGEEGLRWLKIHVANTGDFKVDGTKISKRTLEERVQWCDANIQQIMRVASAPLVHTEWMHAGKPFLHLAACFELTAALEEGSSYVTHLPTSYDGSCSGLQHLSGMTRAAEGVMVNLTSSPLPQDVYHVVAEDTFTQITADLNHTPDPEAEDPEKAAKASKDIRAMAQLFLDYDGDRREMAKRNVMTYSYSSKPFGMACQQQTDLMEPLAREVLEGKRKEHPFIGFEFGPYNKQGVQQPSKAARYIAGRVFDAIETRIHKPAEAMKFLQDIAKTMAHECKPVTWTTPVGIPWINRYHEHDMTSVNLYLVDGGIKERVRFNIATGSKKEIDKAKAANGVAPNFVHALDAAHLLLVANSAAAEGIRSIATVHDSFGCLAPQARRFNAIIREQFALMYETHDVLSEILEQATCDLTPANRNRLPVIPERGPLDLKEILNADFAFA
jgi:DNA-directed RNA polymerase